MSSAGKRERYLNQRQPEVEKAREFLEIVRDFTDPREVVREAVSNSLDWGATEVRVTVTEDSNRPDEELVIQVEDNGIGLNEDRLHAFFDLGRTTQPATDETARRMPPKQGYKGHGTKIYYNSRKVEVWSDSQQCSAYAIMEAPLQKLMDNTIPEEQYDIEPKQNRSTKTIIKIYGYNMNQNKKDFAHNILQDYVLWFTRFGSIEKEFGIQDNVDKTLLLSALGHGPAVPDRIEFGHPFPAENGDIARLRREQPSDWPKNFVKRWIFRHKPILGYPGKFIDMVFYIEGDAAKRSYNHMLRSRGITPEYGMYKVEDRYGLWVTRDYVPIRRYNDWLGLGKRLETKYHAFVNCQEFRLTANRGDIGNTPSDLLRAIEETVKDLFEQDVIGSRAYQEYEESSELEEQYQTARQEGADFQRRWTRARAKKVCSFQGIDLLEPTVEMGVIALFNLVYARDPSLFPFYVLDYDTKRGYDALVSHRTPLDLAKESVRFIEFKYMLGADLNHSFDHLGAIVCWDCNLSDGGEVKDIAQRRRQLRITPPSDPQDYTRYMLVSPQDLHNIEVFALKQYLQEKRSLEFRPRPARPE